MRYFPAPLAGDEVRGGAWLEPDRAERGNRCGQPVEDDGPAGLATPRTRPARTARLGPADSTEDGDGTGSCNLRGPGPG